MTGDVVRLVFGFALTSLAVLTLGGCAMTLPVAVAMQNSPERFSGTATGHIDGAGELELTSSSGEKCTGRFVYISGREGRGAIACSGGRNGEFDFVSTGSRGTGRGQISGEPLTIVFGR